MRNVSLTPDICKTCPQYSKGVCLVFSVNVNKYGKPLECKRIIKNGF